MTQIQRDNFEAILRREEFAGATALTGHQITQLSHFYAIVLKWNQRLHLTTITEPEQFAERHIAESITAAGIIPESIATIWDMGTGLGVPGIPLAILRPDLTVCLVEAGRKKSIYLEEALFELDLRNARVLNRRIEDLDPLPVDALLTARAVEKMERLLPDLLRLGADCPKLLLFGGPELVEKLGNLVPAGRKLEIHRLPGAESRLLIEIYRST